MYPNINDFIAVDDKNEDWAATRMLELYLYGGAKSLLHNKNVDIIKSYADGDQDMAKFKGMFKTAQERTTIRNAKDGMVIPMSQQDLTGIDFSPLAVLPRRLTSAMALIKNIPLKSKVTAIDALAVKKKNQVRKFIAASPLRNMDLQDFKNDLGVEVDAPPPPHISAGMSMETLGLDPKSPDQVELFLNLYGNIRPESALETCIDALGNVIGYDDIVSLQIADQFLYGVSAQRSYFSSITGLPVTEYVHPENVYTPDSKLQDFKDQDYRYIKISATASEIMNMLGSEIEDKDIEEIFDANFMMGGYGGKTWAGMPLKERAMERVDILYFEFKSWDIVKFQHRVNGKGNLVVDSVSHDHEMLQPNPKYNAGAAKVYKEQLDRIKDKDSEAYHNTLSQYNKVKKMIPRPMDGENLITQKYYENTYTGYFFPCLSTKVWKYKKLETAGRKAGQEGSSPFSIQILKTASKSIVEVCVPFVDDIQRAYIKMQHATITAKPQGYSIDYKGIRNAVENFKGSDIQYTAQDLLLLFQDKNIFIYDSEGIDEDDKLSMKPVDVIPGGSLQEMATYMNSINDSFAKIDKLTGLNDTLIGGVSNNPEGLVGLQKLQLQQVLNSLQDITEARKRQVSAAYNIWVSFVQYILKHKGSASYKTILNIIGNYKADVIEDLEDIPAHNFGLIIEDAPSVEQQEALNQELFFLMRGGVLAAHEYYALKRIFNYKDAQLLLSIVDKRKRDEQAQAQQAQIASQEKMKGAELASKERVAATMAQGEINEEQVITQRMIQLEQMRQQFELALSDKNYTNKAAIQRERLQNQLDRQITKHNLDNQSPLGS